jgi:hypothetical protein
MLKALPLAFTYVWIDQSSLHTNAVQYESDVTIQDTPDVYDRCITSHSAGSSQSEIKYFPATPIPMYDINWKSYA